MSIKQNYSKEALQEMSLIELAYLLLEDKKEPVPFHDIIKEVSSMLELSEEQMLDRMPQFYTDMNIDGRFLCIGENKWGLRTWYPLEQIEEETVPTIRPKKKKGKKLVDDDLDIDEFDEIEEEDLDFDDLDEEYEDDEILDEDEDEDDDDFDDLGDDDEDFDDDEIIEEEDYDIDDTDDELIDDEIETDEDDL